MERLESAADDEKKQEKSLKSTRSEKASNHSRSKVSAY